MAKKRNKQHRVKSKKTLMEALTEFLLEAKHEKNKKREARRQ